MIISMAVVCLIITNTQISIGNGQLHDETIPTSIAGCSNETKATAKPLLESAIPTADDGFAFFKIAFMARQPHFCVPMDLVTWFVFQFSVVWPLGYSSYMGHLHHHLVCHRRPGPQWIRLEFIGAMHQKSFAEEISPYTVASAHG